MKNQMTFVALGVGLVLIYLAKKNAGGGVLPGSTGNNSAANVAGMPVGASLPNTITVPFGPYRLPDHLVSSVYGPYSVGAYTP